ncbi:MAG: Outer rane component of tripartite multidrug resistance system [Rhodocyclales bacterium]|nr:Outer rane component of tripartite multidrug resistance system [Rhodocyclales bacterium]
MTKQFTLQPGWLAVPFARACAIVAAAALLAAGCAQIPADTDVLPQKDVAGAQLAANIKLAREGWPETQWWTRFGDAQLNQLIAQALHEGPSLQVAAARVATARATLALDSTNNGNDIDFKAATNRQRYSANGLLPPPIGGSYYTESTLQLIFSHDFDWWGKRRALVAASVGELNARQADYAQAEQTLAAAIVQSYFSMQADRGRLANLDQLRRAQQALVTDKVRRIEHGLATSDVQRTAEAELGATNRQYAVVEAHAARQREALRALIGAGDQALAELVPHPLPDATGSLPPTLGIELLARRPDLQAARARVEASLSRIEASKAAFYPDLNLTAFFGSDSLSLDKLLQAPSRTLFIGPTLTLPLFNSGSLQARLGVARSTRNELIADYNQSVFNAVRDVAQAGVDMQGLDKEAQAQAVSTASVLGNLRNTQARFARGLDDNSGVLDAQIGVLEQHDLDLQLQAQRLLAEVALIKALGGGYRSEPAASPLAISSANMSMNASQATGTNQPAAQQSKQPE